MKLLALIILTFYCTQLSFASTPARGKSLAADSVYEVTDRPLGVWDLPGRFEKRSLQIEEAKIAKQPQSKQKRKKSAMTSDRLRISRSAPIRSDTNLPQYYQGIDRSQFKASDRVVFVPQNEAVKLKSVKAGDIFQSVIEQEIKASPSVPTPIRAMVISGELKGGFFLGEATLDRELKRIILTFAKVRTPEGKTYQIKASGLAPKGTIGLEGEYHSQAGSFFVAELASAAAAGFLDSTINRNQTTFGTYVQEPSLQNSTKSGLVTALSKSADRLAEQTRQAPEFTEIGGYQPIQVIVQEEPIELN